jgi:hypothetical protein
MAKTYASGWDGNALAAVGTQAAQSTSGKSQGARMRSYATTVTFASQPAADTIVIARPAPGEMISSIRLNTGTSTGTATLAVRWDKRDGTSVTLVAAAAYTTTNTDTVLNMTAANLGSVLDGGEIVFLIAAAALPASGTLKVVIETLNN